MDRKYSIREDFAHDIATLEIWCRVCYGYGVTKGEGYRTDEQQRIYREGWKFLKGKWVKSKKYIRSKVYTSQHQKRLAEDLHIWDAVKGARYITDEEWLEIGRIWERLNHKNRWGGRFGVKRKNYLIKIGWDRWHFERRG